MNIQVGAVRILKDEEGMVYMETIGCVGRVGGRMVGGMDIGKYFECIGYRTRRTGG